MCECYFGITIVYSWCIGNAIISIIQLFNLNFSYPIIVLPELKPLCHHALINRAIASLFGKLADNHYQLSTIYGGRPKGWLNHAYTYVITKIWKKENLIGLMTHACNWSLQCKSFLSCSVNLLNQLGVVCPHLYGGRLLKYEVFCIIQNELMSS